MVFKPLTRQITRVIFLAVTLTFVHSAVANEQEVPKKEVFDAEAFLNWVDEGKVLKEKKIFDFIDKKKEWKPCKLPVEFLTKRDIPYVFTIDPTCVKDIEDVVFVLGIHLGIKPATLLDVLKKNVPGLVTVAKLQIITARNRGERLDLTWLMDYAIYFSFKDRPAPSTLISKKEFKDLGSPVFKVRVLAMWKVTHRMIHALERAGYAEYAARRRFGIVNQGEDVQKYASQISTYLKKLHASTKDAETQRRLEIIIGLVWESAHEISENVNALPGQGGVVEPMVIKPNWKEKLPGK